MIAGRKTDHVLSVLVALVLKYCRHSLKYWQHLTIFYGERSLTFSKRDTGRCSRWNEFNHHSTSEQEIQSSSSKFNICFMRPGECLHVWRGQGQVSQQCVTTAVMQILLHGSPLGCKGLWKSKTRRHRWVKTPLFFYQSTPKDNY